VRPTARRANRQVPLEPMDRPRGGERGAGA